MEGIFIVIWAQAKHDQDALLSKDRCHIYFTCKVCTTSLHTAYSYHPVSILHTLLQGIYLTLALPNKVTNKLLHKLYLCWCQVGNIKNVCEDGKHESFGNQNSSIKCELSIIPFIRNGLSFVWWLFKIHLAEIPQGQDTPLDTSLGHIAQRLPPWSCHQQQWN